MTLKKTIPILTRSIDSSFSFAAYKWILCSKIHSITQKIRQRNNTNCYYRKVHIQKCPTKGVFDVSQIEKLNEALDPRDSYFAKKLSDRNQEATKVQESFIENFLANTSQISDEDWNDLLNNIYSLQYGSITEKNVCSVVMKFCARYHNLGLTKSFLSFWKRSGKKFNELVIIGFINVCLHCKSQLTEEDYKIVSNFTNHLILKTPLMTNKVAEAVVEGLSIMNDWEKCLKFVNDLEEDILSKSKIYSHLFICLLDNGQFEHACNIVYEGLSKKYVFKEAVFVKWIESFKQNVARLHELLTLFQNYEIIPTKKVCESLVEAFSQLPHEKRLYGEFVIMPFNGKCQSCCRKLESNVFSDNEFKHLRDAFLKKVLVGNDVFRNTTPQELKQFFQFVKMQAPFDIVIDALNIMYRKGIKESLTHKAILISDAVNYFFARNKRIMIIGRRHMQKLPSNILENVYEKSAVFLINDLSEDDPFTIYATLYSGLHCCFVTKDLMRSEKFKLQDDRLTALFQKWKISHQIIPKSYLKFEVQYPPKFKVCVQKNSSQEWHIPYKDDDRKTDQIQDLSKWLCLRSAS